MVDLNIQLFGGRGSSSGSGSSGGTTQSNSPAGGEGFNSLSDFESSLSGITDPNYGAFEGAYNTEMERVQEIRNIDSQARETGGIGAWTQSALEGERQDCINQLNNMPSSRTASEWGKTEGLRERINAIDRILNTDYSNSTPPEVSIIN